MVPLILALISSSEAICWGLARSMAGRQDKVPLSWYHRLTDESDPLGGLCTGEAQGWHSMGLQVGIGEYQQSHV